VADKGAIELTYNPMGKGVICRVSPYQRFKPPLPAFANGHPLVGKSAKKEMWFLLGQFSSNNQTGSGGKEKQVFSAREALHPVANHRRLRPCGPARDGASSWHGAGRIWKVERAGF
jgi:hypothetical protein